MKIKEHPMRKYCLIKDFDTSCITFFAELSEEQKEYEIVHSFYKTIQGEKNRVYVIASPSAMKQWGMKPMRHRAGRLNPAYK